VSDPNKKLSEHVKGDVVILTNPNHAPRRVYKDAYKRGGEEVETRLEKSGRLPEGFPTRGLVETYNNWVQRCVEEERVFEEQLAEIKEVALETLSSFYLNQIHTVLRQAGRITKKY